MRKTGKRTLAGIGAGALALGLVPFVGVGVANAAVPVTANYTVSADTDPPVNSGVCLVAGSGTTAVSVAMQSTGTLNVVGAEVTGAAKEGIRVSLTGPGVISGITQGTGTAATTNAAQTVLTQTLAGAGTFVRGIQIKPTSAGTITVTMQSTVDQTVASPTYVAINTITITAVTGTCQNGVPSAADSQVEAKATNVAAAANTAAVTVANGATGYVAVALKNAYGGSVTPAGVLTASATGNVRVAWGSAPTAASTATAAVASDGSNNILQVVQATENAPVTSTVTISFNGTAVATRTVTITGPAASIDVSDVTVNPLGGATATGFNFVVKDSAGNQLAGVTPTAVAASVTAPVSVVTFAAASSATATVAGGWTCGATSGAAQVVLTTTGAAGAAVNSAPFTAACASATKNTYTAFLDKASYRPGELVTLTIRALDASGAPVAKTATLGTGRVVSVPGTVGDQPADSVALAVNGAVTVTYVAGSTEGEYVGVVSLPSATVTTPVSFTYTIAGAPVPPVDKALAIGAFRSSGAVTVDGESAGFDRGDLVNIEFRKYNKSKDKWSSWKTRATALVKSNESFTSVVEISGKLRVRASADGVTSNVVRIG